MKKMIGFSAIVFAATLILLLSGSDNYAATGRNNNYSQYSAHGGGTITGVGNDAWGAFKPSTGAYNPGNCAHCHEQHASIGGSEPAPVKPGPSGYQLFDDLAGNAFCNYCHGPVPLNNADIISPQISKTYSHKPTGSAIRNVLCNECHQDSHAATTVTHTEGTNFISGTMSNIGKTFGVSPTWIGGPVGLLPPPAGGDNIVNVVGYTPQNPIFLEHQLCLDCHGNQAGGAIPGLTDISGQFQPGNHSAHPVATTAPYNNALINATPGNYLIGPWATGNNMKMYCGDCHGSDNWGVDGIDGPHGSNNQYMLKDMGPVPGVLDTLCDNCHTTVLPNINGPTIPGGFSGFDDQPGWNPSPGVVPNALFLANGIGDHTLQEHQYPTNPLGCVACHGGLGDANISNIHGANYRWPNPGPANLVGLPTPGPPVAIRAPFLVGGPFNINIYTNTTIPGSGFCASACHTGVAAYRYR